MQDDFADLATTLISPASRGAEVAPSDGKDLDHVTRAIWVGQGGNLTLTLASGANVNLKNVQGGSLLPLRAKAVRATGTSASGIVALW